MSILLNGVNNKYDKKEKKIKCFNIIINIINIQWYNFYWSFRKVYKNNSIIIIILYLLLKWSNWYKKEILHSFTQFLCAL